MPGRHGSRGLPGTERANFRGWKELYKLQAVYARLCRAQDWELSSYVGAFWDGALVMKQALHRPAYGGARDSL
jgi:hypothetical protein